ncbi:MAG: alcohol dehydrogenase catalytic domain-containing protein [Candidatus Atribacteria bacterium]|nr:alcohol dehydrogenase catalytic domain-containing protein [Candidatus Atribacteria bacterium]
MKALVKYSEESGAYKVQDVEIPKIGPHDVLVKIKTTAICGTDLSILYNKYIGRKPVPIPIIVGHEAAGIIADIGKEVRDLKINDRVVIEPLQGCGKCIDCKLGNKNMCHDWEHLGITCDGTFAEYIAVSEDAAHKLPENVSFKNASCLEPIGLTVRSLEHVAPVLGDRAVIIGPGKIGLFHLQALKASGVTEVFVIGLDQDKKRFEIAEQLGADFIINGSKEDPIKKVMDITKGRGVDVVIETANSPKCFSMAIEVAGPKARVSTFGLYPEATIAPVSVIRKGLTIFGDVALLTKHFIRAIRWIEIGKVLAEPVITHSFPLEEAEVAIRVFKEGEEGAVILEN